MIGQGLDRRRLLASGAAVSAIALFPAPSRARAPLDQDLAQAQLAQARRVIAAMAALGEPFAAGPVAAITALEAKADLAGAAEAAMALCDARTLLVASVNAEARVSVSQGEARPELVQSGWRLFLVRIDNPALVPGKIDVTSPQAQPLNNRYPAGHVHAGMEDKAPVTAGDMAQRWLDLDVPDAPPLPAALGTVPFDYHLVALYARDAGRRAATLSVSIGAGTADIGHRGAVDVSFLIAPAQTVTLGVRDADGKPVTASFLVRDAVGRVYPAQTKRGLPDMVFQQRIYRADGGTLTLPPGEYAVEVARGPEYLVQRATRAVLPQGPTQWQTRLERWIDPREQGYFSGDHHIHAAGCSHYESPEEGVTPAVMLPQLAGEAINIGAVLTWGPGFYHQKMNFTGKDDAVSLPQNRLHYDLEVSGFPSSHCGHLVLLQMKGMDYPGTTKIEEWPSSNTPVLQWARSQNAITGYAHSGFGLWAKTEDLPSDVIPPFDGIGANDYIVTVTAGLVDFISAVSTPPQGELNIWYHTLNAGYRTRISGETDWPCVYDENMGMGRSYIKLAGPLTYDAWCAGLKAGRGYVSEGRAHLMNFRAAAGAQKTAMGGADLVLAQPASVGFDVLVAARLEPEPVEAIRKLGPYDKPYWHLERGRLGNTRQVLVELLINGVAVESRPFEADGAQRALHFDYVPKASCWAAIRIGHGAHTNPIWIMIGGAPVRVARSINWCRKAVDQCWDQKKQRVRAAELAAEAARYDAARAVYDARLQEAL